MSDRYGNNDRRNRNEDPYRDYGDWDNRAQGAPRSSSGAGAYSRQSRSNSGNVSGYDRNTSSNSRGTANRGSYSRSSRPSSRYDADGYDSRAGSRSASGYDPYRSTGSRTSDRGATGSYSSRGSSGSYGSYSDTRPGARSNTRAESDRSESGRTRSRSSSADSSRRTSGSDGGQRSAQRTSRDTSASRYSRSAYGSGNSSRSSAGYSAADERYTSSSRRGSHAARSTGTGAASSGTLRDRRSQTNEGDLTPKHASGKRRNVVIAAVVAVAIVLVGAIGAFAYVGSISSNLHEGVDDDLRNALVKTDMANEPFYMLLLGTDKVWWREGTEEGGIYRSDTMILARVDAPQGTISLVSIPRDTLVDLGEYGWQKINAAYGLGGPSLAVEAVSKMTDVNISHYAEVDIDGLSAVVDAIGGIEVEVPIEIDDEDAGGYVAAGWQTLNGEQALILCRSRNAYAEVSGAPDLMRAANQRMVLSAIAHKVLASDIATIAKTVSSVSGYVTTDLDVNDIIGLAQAMQGINTDDAMYTAALPSHSAYVVGGIGYPDMYSTTPSDTLSPTVPDGWYGILDKSDWEKMKQRMDKGQPPSEGYEIDEATGTILATAGANAQDIGIKYCWITVMNGTERSGLATRAMGLLNAAGFDNITIGDAVEGEEYPETLVIYDDSGRAREAEQIIQALGQGRAMQNDGSWIVSNDFLIVIGDDWQGSGSSSSSSSSSTTG